MSRLSFKSTLSKSWLYGCVFATLASTGYAQITVDQSLTIEQYVNDVLLGEGVTATNISFEGSMEQFGYMTGGLDNGFPIEGGLILSSGNAADAFCAGQGCIGCNGPTPTDPDLLEIANDVPPLIDQAFTVGSVNDLCVIEFDFDPAGDFVSFNYIFGSEEYEAFENTQYNDIFAFFLSGAGITGQYNAPVGFPGQAINIATVPGSDPELPITISSVNGTINPEFYVLNDNDDICMNGYTTVLTAVYPVICGETYHIKLAIGDGSDTILDSVVILEEGSFGSPIPTTYESQAAPRCDPDPDDDDVIYCAWEDCGPSTITISRPCAVSSLFPFNFDLIAAEGSEATLGEDLLGLPSSASIPVGEYSLSLTFEVPQDNIDEGTETLYLKVVSGSIESEITVILFDTPAFESELQEEYVVPCDETEEICVELIQDPFYEYPAVEYAWSINGVSYGEDSCITYGALTSSLVEVYLEDGCEREGYHQSVFTVPYEPLDVRTSNDTLLCNGAEMLLTLEVDGGQPPYQIQWDDFNDEDYVHLIDPEENTNYEVVVVDNCDYSEEKVTQVRVQTVETTIVRENLGGDAYQFDVLTDPAEPFEGAYFYTWDFGDGDGSFLRRPVHTFDGVSTYETVVNVVTDIGCTDSDRIDVYGDVIFYIPTAFTPDNDGLNDVLAFNGRQVRLFEIWIFNRWGEQVYHSTDLNEVWTGDVNDGTHYAPNGVYHWLIKATGFDTDAQEFRGFVHLIR
ncbi:choice-of-anchor L domain-containing protein [Flavobacteriales bacterium]|nr:choice-of-anchor L domain-containing protein [Flavobacteriales bacterium]